MRGIGRPIRLQRHALSTCGRSVMLYLPIYLSTYLPIYLSTYLPVPTAYLFCASILHVYPSCLSFLSILLVYPSCLSCMSMLLVAPHGKLALRYLGIHTDGYNGYLMSVATLMS